MNAKAVATTLTSAFLQPWRHRQRFAVYCGGSLGTFGFALINLTLGYDFGADTLNHTISYYLMMFTSLGLLVSPLIYGGFACADSRLYRLIITAVQLAGLLGAITFNDTPLILGPCIACITGPFWGSYHVGMFNHTSDDKRGFEVALAHMVIILGGISAALVGGYLLHHEQESIAVIGGAAALTCGTLLLLAQSGHRTRQKPSAFFQSCRALLTTTRTQSLRVFRQGLIDAPNFIVAVVMYKLGFSALTTGGVLAASIVLGLIVTPIIGTITHRNKQQEQKIGVTGICLSWLLLIVLPISATTFTIFLVMRTISLRFMVAGIETYWYGLRSYEALTLHEVLLSCARLTLTVIAIPFLFWNPMYYIYFAAIVAAVISLIEYRTVKEVR